MMYIIRTKRSRETNGRKLGEFSLDFEAITILNSEEPFSGMLELLWREILLKIV